LEDQKFGKQIEASETLTDEHNQLKIGIKWLWDFT